ncbi:MAG: FAD-dependent monooxygenase [Bdellovibrio sp.]|nr:FAD-dependent monooxygenase [Bdellovibrio sp.]
MISSQHFDVIIVGAGIAGPVLGHLLQQQGKNVLVIDRYAEIHARVCGEYLCPMGVAILEEMGLLKKMVHSYLPIVGMNIINAYGTKLSTNFPNEPNLPTHGLALQRRFFEAEIRQMFLQSGGTLLLGERVSLLEQEGKLWVVKTEKGNSFKTSLLVGADGRKSFVAKKLTQARPVFDKRLAIHAEIATFQENERRGEMHLFSDGAYLGLDPIESRLMNVTLVCYPTDLENKAGGHPGQLLKYYINQSPHLRDKFVDFDGSIKTHTVWPLAHRVAKIVGANWGLVGDAAGFFDPLTGEGIYMALWSCLTLAQSLAMSESMSEGLSRYAHAKNHFSKQKAILNRLFQILIKYPYATHLVAKFLAARSGRGDIFLGIIGNIYSPAQGVRKIILQRGWL